MPTSATPLVPAAMYYIQCNQSKLYLRPGKASDDGSQLVQDNLTTQGGTLAFQWGIVVVDAADGEVRIFNALSGKAIDAKGNKQPPTAGTEVIQYSWQQQSNQVWEPGSLNANEFKTIGSAYDLNIVWEVKDGSKDPGAVVILNAKKGSGGAENQQFQFVPVPKETDARIQVPALAGETVAAGQG